MGFFTALDSSALTAWLHKETLLKRLDAEIDAEADDAAALSPEQREKAAAEVQADLLAVERAEAELVWRALAEGLPVAHRPDCAPPAILSVDVIALPHANPSPGTSKGLSWAVGRVYLAAKFTNSVYLSLGAQAAQ